MKTVAKSLRPPPLLTVSEWADKYRMLSSKASAEPGRWRTSRTPYLREIMDCLSDSSLVQEIVFMKGAQVGGTECGNNWVGYTIHYAPAPMLFVQPTDDVLKKVSRQRITPLIDETPELREKIGKFKSRDSADTQKVKEFPGGVLIMTGANSATGLRSMPAKKLFTDEEDAYPQDVGGEGCPVQLAKARQRTFGKRKHFRVSTPVDESTSRIEPAYLDSDQRKYFVPCPDCGHMQTLRFDRLKWEPGRTETVRYLCENCEYPMENWQKTKMLESGEWRATNIEYNNPKKRGYHLNSLYSPVGWFSWQEIADDWEKCQKKKDPNLIKAFENTVKGVTHKDVAEQPDEDRLYERRDTYTIGKIPDGVLFLTAGVDVQGDRLEVEITGWGRNKVSWSIDYIVLKGDTSSEDNPVWTDLSSLLGKTWQFESNPKVELALKMLAVDTGYRSQTVYNWVRLQQKDRVLAVKGSDSLTTIVGLPRPIDVKKAGKTFKRGIKLWTVGVSIVKGELYGWLKRPKPKEGEDIPVGFCFFPEYDAEYFSQLTAEKLVTRIVKGYPKREWVKDRERNEALDCRVYSRAAAYVCGMDRYTNVDWERLEQTLSTAKDRLIKQPENNQQIQKPKPKKRRSSYW